MSLPLETRGFSRRTEIRLATREKNHQTQLRPTARPKFGGRATAVGVGYQAQVAAYTAVKMLGGDGCVVWDGINGEDIAAITMQVAEPVDDVVVTLRGEPLCANSFSLRLHYEKEVA